MGKINGRIHNNVPIYKLTNEHRNLFNFIKKRDSMDGYTYHLDDTAMNIKKYVRIVSI